MFKGRFKSIATTCNISNNYSNNCDKTETVFTTYSEIFSSLDIVKFLPLDALLTFVCTHYSQLEFVLDPVYCYMNHSCIDCAEKL